MIKIVQILIEEFNTLETDLIQEHIRLGMKASGNWVNSLVVDVREVGSSEIQARLIGPAYTKFLIEGRGPTKSGGAKGSGKLIDEIEKWIKEKSALRAIENKIGLKSLAFLITRKIHEKGTKYYRQGGTKLLDSVVTTARIERIITRVREELRTIIVDDIRQEFEKMAK